MAVYALYWRENNALVAVYMCMGITIILSPCIIYFVFTRFATAPGELITTRFEQYRTALQIWRDYPMLGYGAGNYMHALESYGEAGYSSLLPVHNIPLWTLAETGLFGFVIFYYICLKALHSYWHLIKIHAGFYSFLALSLCAGLVGSFVDGLTDPSLRGPSVYLAFWLFLSLSVALPRIYAQEHALAGPPAEAFYNKGDTYRE
jgi:O-antigen ligase